MILFDDLIANPREVVRDLFRYLNIDPAFVPDTSVRHNPAIRAAVRLAQSRGGRRARPAAAVRAAIAPVQGIGHPPAEPARSQGRAHLARSAQEAYRSVPRRHPGDGRTDRARSVALADVRRFTRSRGGAERTSATLTFLPRAKLLTVLGVTFGLAVTVGNMIGAGILRTPGDIAAHLPTFWPFLTVWIIGGLYALLGANALAELGTLVPESGGQYVFVRRALGDYAGFVVGWSDWISTCGTTAAVSIVVGEYSLVLFPQLRGIEPIALAVIAILTLIQWFGVRWGGWTQDATSLLKALAFLFLIARLFLPRRAPSDGGVDRGGARRLDCSSPSSSRCRP